MRYDCDDPAFAGNFIEFSDSWSRGQERAIWDAADTDNDLFLSLLRRKVVSLYLSCIDAEPIIAADDLTPERADQIDVRLYAWFVSAWLVHRQELTKLGNALGRTLFATSAVATKEAALANPNHS